MMMKACVVCGKEFATRTGQRHCGDSRCKKAIIRKKDQINGAKYRAAHPERVRACNQQSRDKLREQRGQPAVNHAEKACLFCGELFVPRNCRCLICGKKKCKRQLGRIHSHSENARKARAKWYSANREALLKNGRERMAKDRLANPQKFLERDNKWRTANKEKCRKNSRENMAKRGTRFKEVPGDYMVHMWLCKKIRLKNLQRRQQSEAANMRKYRQRRRELELIALLNPTETST